MTQQEQVLKALDSLNISYGISLHPAVYTVAEAKEMCNIDGYGCKNLFLYDKKTDTHYLVVMLEDKKAHTNTIRKQIKSSSISFGSEDDLMNLLGVTPGSVSPFGIINDKEHRVIVLLDNDFVECDKLCFHPNINTATVSIKYDDFIRFIDNYGNEYRFINVSKL